MRVSTRFSWILIPILLLGFVLLMQGLLDEGLWADEGWTIAATAEANPADVITKWVRVDVHPPLFFIGLNTWRRFTGGTIFEMRYYSVMISMLGIAVAYRMGKSLFGHRAGVYSALFYALHDLIRVLGQEVRHYPQQMALSALVIWMYSRFWKNPTRGRGIAFVLAGAALIYSHYWGVFVLLALAIHALITRRKQLMPYIVAFAGIGLLYLPWLPTLYHQITLERPGGLPHALENTQYVYAVLLYQLLGVPEWFWIIMMLVGALGAFALTSKNWRQWMPSAASLAPLLIVVLTPLLSVLINTAYPTLSFRSLAVMIPAAMALAAYGLSRFQPREQYIIAAFIVLHSLTSVSAKPAVRADWQGMAEYLVQHSTSDDVIFLELDTDEYSTEYYLQQTDAESDYIHSETTRTQHPDDYPALRDGVLDESGGVWIAKLGWPLLETEYDARPELAALGYVETAPELQYGMHIDRPMLLWRMDHPPQGEPRAVFGDELRLMTADASAHPGGVTINLLWSPSAVPAQEYTISAFLLGTDGTFRNVDSRPLNGRSATSTWQAGGLYFDSSFIPTDGLAAGTYQAGVQVYYFADASFTQIENVPVSDCSADPNCRYILITEVQVGS